MSDHVAKIEAAKTKCASLERKKMEMDVELKGLQTKKTDLEGQLRDAGLPIDNGLDAVTEAQVDLEKQVTDALALVETNIESAEEALTGMQGGFA